MLCYEMFLSFWFIFSLKVVLYIRDAIGGGPQHTRPFSQMWLTDSCTDASWVCRAGSDLPPDDNLGRCRKQKQSREIRGGPGYIHALGEHTRSLGHCPSS